MADPTLPLTHYFPWDGDEQRAVCGTAMHDQAHLHSLLPTCAECARILAAEADLVEATVRRLETSFPIAFSQVAAYRQRRFR